MARFPSSLARPFFNSKATTETERPPEELPSDRSESKDIGNSTDYSDGASNDDNLPEMDLKLDKRITHRFDRRILPWLFGIWLLAFIDRSNIGNAKIVGLEDDLELDDYKFNISLAIFYVPYICVDVPSNWIVKYFGAGHYLPFLLISWGIVSLCTGFVTSYAGLLAVRFFLGLCEGGLLGGLVIYLAMFYPRKQMLRRVSYFYCAAPLSGAFGGLLATGLAEIKTSKYQRWPFIFFVEGAITVAFGFLAAAFLPHTPGHAKFLSEAERDYATSRMLRDSQGGTQEKDVQKERFSWRYVRMALLNWNTWLLSFNFFLIITPIYSFSLFLPTIIKALGYSSVNAQLLTVPPNICGFITVLVAGYASDRLGWRGPVMLVGLVIALIGYIMLITAPTLLVGYGGTFLVAAGIFFCSPIVMTWLNNNIWPFYAKSTATGFQIGVANMAAFLATFTYLPGDAPAYKTGHAINIAVVVAAIFLTIGTMIYQMSENKIRERGGRDNRLETEGGEGAAEGMLGHRHPKFRYTV